MIGILGGSGFYSLLENIKEQDLNTPYGKPSSPIMVGEHAGKSIAFLPRHGKNHEYPPHKIPYRANLWALKEVGVKRIFAPCACGSLQPEYKPGDFVICDQFFDRTKNREDTFYDGPRVAHVSSADPYCPSLRHLAFDTAKELGITAHNGGTIVVIEGPRFSTRAESRFFSNAGFGVINMTQYPECILARELGLCYCNISLITDYDAGIEEMEPVTNELVIKTFKKNNEKLKKLLLRMIEKIDTINPCDCHKAMDQAFM